MKQAGPSEPQPVTENPISKAIVFIVDRCTRHAWVVIACAVLLTIVCGLYASQHFAINTDTNEFLSRKLPWRQHLIALDKAFPQRNGEILVVVDGATPELAENASAELAKKLQARTDLFVSVQRPDGGDYFNQNALLFQPVPALKQSMQGLLRAQPFLAALTGDPSLRGVVNAFGFVNRGVKAHAGTFDDFDRPMVQMSQTLEDILAGKRTFFSWSTLLSGQKPDIHQVQRFILTKPKLDYRALQPGLVASNAIRQDAQQLGLTPDKGVTIRLTGSVPLSDDEYASVREGSTLNGIITGLIVLFIIWLALKSMRIVFAVGVTVGVGLAITAAVGLLMVGALNLISVAFAVLFVGIGADFGIQFSVRYRSERHEESDIHKALLRAAVKAGRPLALAAAATTAGFYSFLPTDYRGISELGLIAGTGMIIAFLTSITVLPALLAIFKPPAELEGVGFTFLAPVDKFLSDHRHAIVIGTLLVAFAGAPLLTRLTFDFNPINLRDKHVESVATLLDLMNQHDAPVNYIDILAPSLDAADPLVAKLQKVPEAGQVITLKSLIPQDQDEKLPLIEKTAGYVLPLFDPSRLLPPPTPAEEVEAMKQTADQFVAAAGQDKSKGANDARHLADLLRQLAAAPQATRDTARNVFVPSLKTMLALLHQSLQAKKTSIDQIPAQLRRDWVASDGQALIEVAPKGDPNDNVYMTRFANAVMAIAPAATGEPIAVQESGKTIIRAFIEAGLWALLSISIILYIVLRRVTDVLMTLVPLMLAGLVSLEITVLLHMPLNFANIIALPLMLGLGVAFKIYFVMAWRAGTTNLLQSSLTRAVFFSAMTTATAFGSLWLSHHPGTSSMGKLLALSLITTLAAAVLFQPALMGPPRKVQGSETD
jgi:hopanoid biosynthesis associated RND transporter like protein HpnN